LPYQRPPEIKVRKNNKKKRRITYVMARPLLLVNATPIDIPKINNVKNENIEKTRASFPLKPTTTKSSS
jgi:hypothetical protein